MEDPNSSQPKAYANAQLRLSLLGGAADLAALILFLVLGYSRSLARHLPGGPVLRVCLYVLALGAGLKLLDLPFDWLARRIEIRFGMNRQSLAGWLADEAKGTLLGATLAVAAAELIYWLLRSHPGDWWLWAWAATMAFVVLMAQLGPVLLLPIFYKLRQMSDTGDTAEAALVQRLQATYARLKTENPRLPTLHGIYEWKLGEKSAKANAALTGLGRTRRVIVSDTLLADSTPGEIEAVFLHELGHHVHGDIWRGLGFETILAFIGFWLAQQGLHAFSHALSLQGPGDVAGLPLLILVFTVLGLVLLPARNAFVRAMERRADDYSFAKLGSAQPLLAGLRRLAARNLAEVEPPRWREWLLYSHPAIATRIRRGEAWEAAHRGTVTGA